MDNAAYYRYIEKMKKDEAAAQGLYADLKELYGSEGLADDLMFKRAFLQKVITIEEYRLLREFYR